MANSVKFNDTVLKIGDTVSLSYKIKEGEKTRQQLFKGILINIKGSDANNRMITIRKVSKTGIGVERIIPLSSPFISTLKVEKSSSFKKAKLYFIRKMTDTEVKHKLYAKK